MADCGLYLLHYTEKFFTNRLGGPEEMTRYIMVSPLSSSQPTLDSDERLNDSRRRNVNTTNKSKK